MRHIAKNVNSLRRQFFLFYLIMIIKDDYDTMSSRKEHIAIIALYSRCGGREVHLHRGTYY